MSIDACGSNYLLYGKVKQYNAVDKRSFVFSIEDDFLRKNNKSAQDKAYPIMTEAEVWLLKALLSHNGYCLKKDGKPSFVINSRQEKIYDITFAHLIEQSYNARPVAPRMYFGECVP